MGVWIALAALCGCPQLLDDGFDTGPALPKTNLDSSTDLPSLDGDAGVEPSSASGGAAGMSGTLVTGGSGSTSDASAAGAGTETADASDVAGAGGTSAEPDASPPVFVTELGPLLAHRYRFDGSGSVVADSVGNAPGTVIGTVLVGNGKLSLLAANEYVDLPDWIVSSYGNATLEAWVNWQGGAAWQNVFDFGANTSDDSQGQATSHVFVTTKSGDTNHMSAGYTTDGYNGEIAIDSSRVFPSSADPTRGTQVVLVVSATRGSLELYIDGLPEVSISGQAITLAAISDVNNWLGRSQYGSDPYFQGEYLDFRIYDHALTADQVSLSFDLGADAEL